MSNAKSVPDCAPFSVRTAPTASLPFRQAVELSRLLVPPDASSSLALGCVRLDLDVSLALDFAFQQVWNFQQTLIADLHTTLSLAPREEVQLELKSTQRKTLEQSVIDSVEDITSNESLIVDKDTLNTARSSASANNWQVDGSGSFSVGGLTLGASAGISGSLTQTATTTAEQVHEATKKSAENLKTLHKIEVRGVSESITEDRVVRRIKNPYDDRTLTLNVFQLLKRYSVSTRLDDHRPAIVVVAKKLVVDRTFVLNHVGFLKQTLLDADLLKDLLAALGVARRPPSMENLTEAQRVAGECLFYLFEAPNMFQLPDIGAFSNNDPSVSFNGSLEVGLAKSGFSDSLANNASSVFTMLSFFYRKYMDVQPPARAQQAIGLAVALASGLKPAWEAFLGAGGDSVSKVLDKEDFTEVVRRVAGFLAMVDGVLRPLLQPADQDRDAQVAADAAEFVIERVIAHINCHAQYYVLRFLEYTADQTRYVTLTSFVRDVLARLQLPPPAKSLLAELFDPSRAFLDRNEIVVRAARPYDYRELASALGLEVGSSAITMPPLTADIDVPFDGVHLEIAPGVCRLPDVPARSDVEIGEIAVRNVKADSIS